MNDVLWERGRGIEANRASRLDSEFNCADRCRREVWIAEKQKCRLGIVDGAKDFRASHPRICRSVDGTS